MASPSLTLTPQDNDTVSVEVDVSRVDGPTTAFLYLREGDESAATWLTATETRAVIAALQATLPSDAPAADAEPHTITTAAELDALPVGARVEDEDRDVWTKGGSGSWVMVPGHGTERSHFVARYLPGTLLTPEILDTEKDTDDGLADWERALLGGDGVCTCETHTPEPTTAGTLRLDLRLFLGDRDITYALANPIAEALEG
jgi:hypothetical protein